MSITDASVIDAACRAVWGEEAPSVSEHLQYALAQSPRTYHTARHIADMLRLLSQWEADVPHSLTAAVLFHDAVYDPRRNDNEERSADLFTAMSSPDFAEAEAAETVRLILLTKTHDPASDDRNGVLLTNADLWVLGSLPDDYAAYANAIRQEYAHVPEDAWRTGRARVLHTFLGREPIYPSSTHAPPATTNREVTARRNLTAEIARLETSSHQP